MLTGVINGNNMSTIAALNHWSNRNPHASLEIQITSPGGSVFDGLAVFDFLRELSNRGHHVTTRAYGIAASMGGILLQAGDMRELTANSYLMIHELSSLVQGSVSSQRESVETNDRIQARLVKLLVERANVTADELAEKVRKYDWYLDPEEALTLGFIDGIALD